MRRVTYVFAAVALVVTLGACTSAKQTTTGGWLPGHAVVSDPGVLLLRVPDAVERGEGPAGGSGQAMTLALFEGMQQKQVKVSLVDESEVASAAAKARDIGLPYVMRAAFTIWEDNATAWSGNPDRVGLAVELYNASDATLVAMASHTEVASSASLVSSSPDRFYPVIVQTLLNSLFGYGSAQKPVPQ